MPLFCHKMSQHSFNYQVLSVLSDRDDGTLSEAISSLDCRSNSSRSRGYNLILYLYFIFLSWSNNIFTYQSVSYLHNVRRAEPGSVSWLLLIVNELFLYTLYTRIYFGFANVKPLCHTKSIQKKLKCLKIITKMHLMCLFCFWNPHFVWVFFFKNLFNKMYLKNT